jgi:hypothetical protein
VLDPGVARQFEFRNASQDGALVFFASVPCAPKAAGQGGLQQAQHPEVRFLVQVGRLGNTCLAPNHENEYINI